MQGLEIEAVYERGTLKLPRELPLQEGQKVTITIHSGAGALARLYGLVPYQGNLEEFDRWLNDPDEGLYGCHNDDPPTVNLISLNPECVIDTASTESKPLFARESPRD